MNYLYFPGCSLKSTGRAYEESMLAVFQALDVPLKELDDWNCCGATAYMSIDEVRRSRWRRATSRSPSSRRPTAGAPHSWPRAAPATWCSQDAALHRSSLRGRRQKVQRRPRTPRTSLQRDESRSATRSISWSTTSGWSGIKKPVEAPAERAEGGLLLRLPGRAAVRRRSTSRITRPRWTGCVTALGATTGRLAAEDPLLRREPDRHHPGGGLRLNRDPLKEANRRGADIDGHRLPALPAQPGMLPGRDQPRQFEGDHPHAGRCTSRSCIGLALRHPPNELGLQRLVRASRRAQRLPRKEGEAAHV